MFARVSILLLFQYDDLDPGRASADHQYSLAPQRDWVAVRGGMQQLASQAVFSGPLGDEGRVLVPRGDDHLARVNITSGRL
jgi:hypothetical protein